MLNYCSACAIFSGLQKYLNQQGFNIVGYGCTTCIGNSGDLDETVASTIAENGNTVLCGILVIIEFGVYAISNCIPSFTKFWYLLADIVAAAVLSGNRNFEGRVHPLTRANYLASPPLVVAYALAGTVYSSLSLTIFIMEVKM